MTLDGGRHNFHETYWKKTAKGKKWKSKITELEPVETECHPWQNQMQFLFTLTARILYIHTCMHTYVVCTRLGNMGQSEG